MRLIDADKLLRELDSIEHIPDGFNKKRIKSLIDWQPTVGNRIPKEIADSIQKISSFCNANLCESCPLQTGLYRQSCILQELPADWNSALNNLHVEVLE